MSQEDAQEDAQEDPTTRAPIKYSLRMGEGSEAVIEELEGLKHDKRRQLLRAMEILCEAQPGFEEGGDDIEDLAMEIKFFAGIQSIAVKFKLGDLL